jgi:hypothetical protein
MLGYKKVNLEKRLLVVQYVVILLKESTKYSDVLGAKRALYLNKDTPGGV